MGTLYWSTRISQKKLDKVKRDIINDKYVHSETWEVLDIYSEKQKPKRLKRNYRTFNVLNRKMKNLYTKLWATYYWHLIILIQNMSVDNSIDYSILPVSQQTLKAIKKLFKEQRIIVKGNLNNKTKYYVNPDISTYWETYDFNLVELFKDKKD